MFPGMYARCLALLCITAIFVPSALAQETAVLIGIAKFFRPIDPALPDHPQLGVQYNTVLIVRDGAKAHIRATLPDIIVPHERDWWRVGVRVDCQIRTEPDDTGESVDKKVEDWVEQLYMSRIRKAPQVPDPFGERAESCPAQLVADFRRAKDSRITTAEADQNAAWPFEPCIYRTATITAVTPNFVSTTHHGGNSGFCETSGFSWSDGVSTLRIEDSSLAAYSDVVGDEGLAEYNRELVESGKALETYGFNCALSQEGGHANSAEATDTGWFLQRNEGKWIALALEQPGRADCQYGGPLSLPLPRELVGYDTLQPEWSSLERQIHGLHDAFTSPAGDLVVAVKESQVEIYGLTGKKVGSKLLTLPANRVVMVQWARGKHVNAWVKELQRWQRKGLPPTVIRKAVDSD